GPDAITEGQRRAQSVDSNVYAVTSAWRIRCTAANDRFSLPREPQGRRQAMSNFPVWCGPYFSVRRFSESAIFQYAAGPPLIFYRNPRNQALVLCSYRHTELRRNVNDCRSAAAYRTFPDRSDDRSAASGRIRFA